MRTVEELRQMSIGWLEEYRQRCEGRPQLAGDAELIDQALATLKAENTPKVCIETREGEHEEGSRLMSCWACNAQ